MEKGKFIDFYIAQIISRWLFIRDHSRNKVKGVRKLNSPDASSRQIFSDHFSQFMFTTKSPGASSNDFT